MNLECYRPTSLRMGRALCKRKVTGSIKAVYEEVAGRIVSIEVMLDQMAAPQKPWNTLPRL